MSSWATRLHAGRHVQFCRYPAERDAYINQFTSTKRFCTYPSLLVSRRYGHTAANRCPPACRKTIIKSRNPQSPRSAFLLSRLHSTTTQTSVDCYIPPKTGLIASLPRSWIPYAELLRLDKPTGTYYLFFPCAYSTLLAASMVPSVPVLQVVGTMGLFFSGALIMRGAGCAINDLWDRNLDPHVERTKFRPIARGAISPGKAVLFTGSQLLAGLGILLQFPYQCLWYGIPSLILVTTYPLAKRITYYPQAVLGLTFSWGAIMGFPALGVDLLNNGAALEAAAALYSSCVAWTILYDMIYAHMDIKDDVAAGIKSIALRHENNTKAVLSALAAVQVSLLAAAGVAAGSGPIFFVGGCGSAAISLGLMIWKVQLKDVRNCWWWFKNGCLFTGGGITLGMLFDYVAQVSGFYEATETPNPLERS
ncbi:putative para-hydroxybenzoate-polyprenyltransferase Coq2 [Aspergillus ibericus CBS 121593]|uniref:4-hydroxybenzoate polyprenyltransferase, mitochondrial n=1 Tax=Aspergillus ibericus CBS 121593 TaxID=1448316 RepID=A0A395HDW3_9EURO|nr:4-hydroxybenzoate polyprenyl transferase [Aspergillus ibericus CBS 121593]RAL05689.1 4-hydroxybenzoate polyprenyl transferase [Aspergillus ibericus CBS 121593]